MRSTNVLFIIVSVASVIHSPTHFHIFLLSIFTLSPLLLTPSLFLTISHLAVTMVKKQKSAAAIAVKYV